MERSNEWIAFLGWLWRLAPRQLDEIIPDLITTVAAIVGVAGMIYEYATGILIVGQPRAR